MYTIEIACPENGIKEEHLTLDTALKIAETVFKVFCHSNQLDSEWIEAIKIIRIGVENFGQGGEVLHTPDFDKEVKILIYKE